MVLLGMVPVLMQTPPTTLCFSTTATRFPALAAWIAARCPPGPEPMTTRSYGCIGHVLDFRFECLGGDHGGRRRVAIQIHMRPVRCCSVHPHLGHLHEVLLH